MPDTRTFEQKVLELARIDVGEAFDRDQLVRVNRAMRSLDESHLWPIRNRFDVTERAIRRVRTALRDYGPVGVTEYVAMVDGEIGRIVNDPRI